MKIKKGDHVIVRSGKDKGKTGQVERALPKLGKVVIAGVNVATKHQKNRRARSQGQVIKKPIPVPASIVALVENGRAVRIGYKLEDGKKIRVSRKTGKTV